MKNISAELSDFLEATGVRQCQLAEASGVSTATISRLVRGKQKDVRLSNISALRGAMDALRQDAPPRTPPTEASPEVRS